MELHDSEFAIDHIGSFGGYELIYAVQAIVNWNVAYAFIVCIAYNALSLPKVVS